MILKSDDILINNNKLTNSFSLMTINNMIFTDSIEIRLRFVWYKIFYKYIQKLPLIKKLKNTYSEKVTIFEISIRKVIDG